jgi:RNA polymerase sigma factor (sigma-70 family)
MTPRPAENSTMTATRANVVLRHIRELAAAEGAGALDDHQLLQRFATVREEAAFAALVRRHGPLVLGVCRRILHDPHDAEDAFQATFLALARRAASVGRRAALATWLYQVAYHAALRTRKLSAVRRQHEGKVPPRRPHDPLAEVTGRELLAVLDEELARLPERLRSPLVLCYLEGKARDEAARELGWSLGTLKRRLEQGRAVLHARLAGRGLSLAALLAAGLGGAAVSTSLAGATVAAARLVPAAAGAGRKLLAVSVLVLGLAAAGAGLLNQRTPAAPPAAAPEAKARPAPPEKKAPPPAPPADDKKETAVVGRVLSADGKPVLEAHVALAGLPRTRHPFDSGWLGEKVLASGRTDAEGRFRIGLAGAAREGYQDVFAVAGKDGHGLTWGKVPRTGGGPEFVLRLTAEKLVRGRVLDLQGLPVAGAEVRLFWLGGRGDERQVDVGVWGLPRDRFPPWPAPTKTDKDGRFVLRGINPNLEGTLIVDGDGLAPAHAYIKAGADEKTQEMKVILLPAVVVEGVVTAADTGKPVPGALVRPVWGDAVRTDDKGRYRVKPGLEGSHRIEVMPPDSEPYLPVETTAEWPKGAVRHELNLTLPRGVLVRGKVTEGASGKPIDGAVIYDGGRLWLRWVKSGADGTFAIAVAPGRNPLLVKGPDNDYVALQVTSKELSRDARPYYRLYPDALVPLDLKAGAGPVEVSAKLRRGVTLRGRLLGPDDKPAGEAVLLCWNQLPRYNASWFASPVAVRDGEFELRGCDPDETYPVHFLDSRHQWGASVKVTPKEVGDKPLTVRLEKCGRVVVRFVNKEGKPVPGYSPYVNVVCRPGTKNVEADSDFVANVDHINYHGGGGYASGADGRATFPALIPGVMYRLYGPGMKDKEVSAKAGETADVPDVVVER